MSEQWLQERAGDQAGPPAPPPGPPGDPGAGPTRPVSWTVLLGGLLVLILVAVGSFAVGRAISGKNPPSQSSAPPPTSNDPSGVAMPTGNLPGWTMAFSDDFTGSTLNENKWGPYSGEPNGDSNGWWDPSHVVESGGVLNLESYVDPSNANPSNPNGYVSGGVSNGRALHQTYGKYEVRFRIDQGAGIASALLLWPAEGGWPPEIDFAENGSGVRDHMTATLHYGSDDSTIQKDLNGDFTQWHTLGVEWTPGSLAFTMDGSAWATITGSEVPSVPMELDMQTQAGACGVDPCPDASTPSRVDMQIDWVVAYAYTPSSGASNSGT